MDELTETEQRVAELIARGLTNKAAAQAAFLSPKTVDNVLGRVYRKLGIASRAELGAIMGAGTAAPGLPAAHLGSARGPVNPLTEPGGRMPSAGSRRPAR